MASYLGAYKKAATGRDKKIIRAIRSVVNQTFKDWELIIVSDGCKKTIEIVSNIGYLYNDERISLIPIEKQTQWSGTVRNTGLDAAKGDYCCYLDVDDAFAPGHLQGLFENMGTGKDWYWFNDYTWNGKDFQHKKRNINKPGQCGTSNVLHKKDLARWDKKGTYAHDWIFIKNLKRASSNYEYIKAGEYLICHVPGRFDI